MNFEELNIKKELLKVIEESGFTIPTQIQSEIIPLILEGNDVLGKSATGTGKTLAFAAALLSKIELNNSFVKTLVIAPTRELAMQVEEEIKKLSKYLDIKTLCVYGSSNITNQIKALKGKIDIVVGTPGRVLDLIKRKSLKLENIEFFVLDEADEMLNMGFKEDIEAIFKVSNPNKQVLLFSATMPKTILGLAKKYMNSAYKEVSVINDAKMAENIEQKYYLVEDKKRVESMCRIMDKYSPEKCIIFCKTKRNADDLFGSLSKKGYNVEVIHGDIVQTNRIKALERFKNKQFNYLLATDVAARGIHVDDIELIINYNLPQDNETYVHRIGRTGRAGNKGLAVTLVSKMEERILYGIERHIKANIELSELPTKEEIISSRFNAVVNNLTKNLNNNNNPLVTEYIKKLNNDELKNICSALLEEKFSTSFGSDFNLDTSLTARKDAKNNRRENNNGTRVFLTIGKMDGIDKKSLLTELEKISGLAPGTMFSVEVMTKFTFLSVENKSYGRFVEKCNNCKVNGRVIKIDKAKK